MSENQQRDMDRITEIACVLIRNYEVSSPSDAVVDSFIARAISIHDKLKAEYLKRDTETKETLRKMMPNGPSQYGGSCQLQ